MCGKTAEHRGREKTLEVKRKDSVATETGEVGRTVSTTPSATGHREEEPQCRDGDRSPASMPMNACEGWVSPSVDPPHKTYHHRMCVGKRKRELRVLSLSGRDSRSSHEDGNWPSIDKCHQVLMV